jgi:hypothetical protein
MSIDLSSYTQIETGLFIEIIVTPSLTLRFSDYNRTISLEGESYTSLGKLISLSSSSSELKTSNGAISLVISGIPNQSITDILSNPFKGAKVIVRRAFFDLTSGDLLDIEGNPTGRFFGIINNYSLDEEYDVDQRVSSNSISFDCVSWNELLENKVSGRKTNPNSFRILNPSDASMDRVPNLVNSNFDFGAQ